MTGDKSRVLGPRNKISSVAKFLDLLQKAMGLKVPSFRAHMRSSCSSISDNNK